MLALRGDFATHDFVTEHLQLPPDADADISYLVALVAGDPVGHLHLKWAGNGEPLVRNRLPGVPELNNISVWPPALQSRGIGSTLIACAEDTAAERGHHWVGLGVEVTNARARALYERLGYRDWGHGIYYERWTEYGDLGTATPRSEPCRYMLKRLHSDAETGIVSWEALSKKETRTSVSFTTVDAESTVAELLALAVGGDATAVAAVCEGYRTNPNWLLLAATIDGRCVGIAGFTVTDVRATLLHIATSPRHRGAGVGTALLGALRARLPPDRPLVAETDAEAVGFYRRNGLTVTSLGEKFPGVERFMARLDPPPRSHDIGTPRP